MGHFVIAAIGPHGEIGERGGLPWPLLRSDALWFREVTQSRYPLRCAGSWVASTLFGQWPITEWPVDPPYNAVIMGHTTWEGLPRKPLTQRLNLVLNSTALSLEGALRAAEHAACPHVFVMGGSAVYAAALERVRFDALFLTLVRPLDGHPLGADTWFPRWNGRGQEAYRAGEATFVPAITGRRVEDGYALTFSVWMPQ